MKLTKEEVARQIQDGYYNDHPEKFNNKKFREDLKAINFDLSDSTFSYVHFDFADLHGINFSNCVFMHCVFEGMKGRDWRGTRLSGAKFLEPGKMDKELLEKLELAAQTHNTRKQLLKAMREKKLEQIRKTLKRNAAYLAASRGKTSKAKVQAYRQAMGLNRRKPK